MGWSGTQYFKNEELIYLLSYLFKPRATVFSYKF